MKHIYFTIYFLVLFVASLQKANAQFLTPTVVYEEGAQTVTVIFNDVVEIVNKTAVPPSQATLVDCPDIIYKKDGQPILLFCDALADGNKIILSNFRSGFASTSSPVDLKGNTKYSIQWDAVKDRGSGRALSAITKLELDKNSPRLNLLLARDNEENKDSVIKVTPIGLDPADLIKVFEQNPGLIKVLFDFPGSDPAFDFETEVTEISRVSDSRGETNVLLFKLKDSFPYRPEKYSAVVKIPWKEILSSGRKPTAGFYIPDLENLNKDTLNGSIAIIRTPEKAERGKAEYSFEAGFTSIVNPTNEKRNNVGIFGLTIKPFIPVGFFGVGRGDSNRSAWLALRPLLIADVDTQKVSQSKSPNRIQLGADLEWGNNFNRENFLPTLIWTNGLRYDSDRDFKLQTMYWRTELTFRFRDAEQSFDYRLFRRQLAQNDCQKRVEQECVDMKVENCAEPLTARCGTRKEPFVSSYFIRPSIGYDLGGTIRRDAREINAPTKNISRAFIHLTAGIELKRIAKFSIDDTYYYLQNASQRKNRNYLETIFELNMGRLSGIDINGFSNSIFLKYQRGHQPPTFGEVDAFSIGFKIYR